MKSYKSKYIYNYYICNVRNLYDEYFTIFLEHIMSGLTATAAALVSFNAALRCPSQLSWRHRAAQLPIRPLLQMKAHCPAVSAETSCRSAFGFPRHSCTVTDSSKKQNKIISHVDPLSFLSVFTSHQLTGRDSLTHSRNRRTLATELSVRLQLTLLSKVKKHFPLSSVILML